MDHGRKYIISDINLVKTSIMNLSDSFNETGNAYIAHKLDIYVKILNRIDADIKVQFEIDDDKKEK